MQLSQRLKTCLSTVFAGVALLGIAGCESAQDKARKPELVNQIVANSIDVCSDVSAKSVSALRACLSDAYSTSLDFFIGNKIAICPDQRLENAKLGFFDTRPNAAFYLGEKPVVGLRYDGESTSDYAAALIDRLPDEIGDGVIMHKGGDSLFGYSYWQSTGKSGYMAHKWSSARGFSALEKNPYLAQPPLK